MAIEERTRLEHGFLDSAERWPDHVALEVDGVAYSYAELLQRAEELSLALLSHPACADDPVVAVYGDRTLAAYVGVLGSLLAGKAFLPLNPAYPATRNAHAVRAAGSSVIVSSTQSLAEISEFRPSLKGDGVVLVPEGGSEPTSDPVGAIFRTDFEKFLNERARSSDDKAPSESAYVIFTSGSTGTPKGVATRHSAVMTMLNAIRAFTPVTETDRCSQCYELSFDGSIIDMFIPWGAGAALCVPSRKSLIMPGKFILQSGITWWFSVPSIGAFMSKMGGLKPAKYPGLRWSLFGGEALPVDLATQWQQAAPGSAVLNLYGPTEAAVESFCHRFDVEGDQGSEHGIVPIGVPNPELEYLVVGPEDEQVPVGEKGELLISGPQLADGYIDDPERSAAAFVTIPGQNGIFYRTGDVVRRPIDRSMPLSYLGRSDYQVQIRGHRVELGEVEAVARRHEGVRGAVAMPWPVRPGATADGIVLFVESQNVDPQDLTERVAAELPEYMVPRRVVVVPKLPLTAHGKYDRLSLAAQMEEDR